MYISNDKYQVKYVKNIVFYQRHKKYKSTNISNLEYQEQIYVIFSGQDHQVHNNG